MTSDPSDGKRQLSAFKTNKTREQVLKRKVNLTNGNKI